MSRKNSIINTPELLRAFHLGVPYKNIDSYPEVQAPNDSLTEEEKEQQYESRPKVLGGDTEIKTANSSNYVKDNSSITVEETDYSTNKSWKDIKFSKPSKLKLGKNQVGGTARIKMKKPFAIVLHHTATYFGGGVEAIQASFFRSHFKDKKTGKKTSEGWKSSHSIISRDGHIEYVVPLPYRANAQAQNYFDKGKSKSPSFINFNNISISTELNNFGYLNKKFTKNGKTLWYRKNKDAKDGGKKYNLEESQTSVPYDFNLQTIPSYKGYPRCEEYSDVQLNSMVKWIKEMQKYIHNNTSYKEILNWKYTQKTHNQMFPNYQSKNLPKNFATEGAYYTEGPNNEYLITGGGNTYGWAVSTDINNSIPGIYTHNSISAGKSDIFPTKKMVQCLIANFS